MVAFHRVLAIGYFFRLAAEFANPAICHLSFGICHSEARASAFISLAHSRLSATVTALFFEKTLSSSGLGHRPFTARILPDSQRLTKGLPQITADWKRFSKCTGTFRHQSKEPGRFH
jgi:hypothetical protein